jgi:YD repeat-containing protein
VANDNSSADRSAHSSHHICDAVNRLQVQKSTVGIATYSYDASGRRTRKYYVELASGSDAVSTYVVCFRQACLT